jgi:hypothetical protein
VKLNKTVILALIDAIINDKIDSGILSNKRGPRGFRGKDGEDFDFDEHKAQILQFVKQSVIEQKAEFRLTEDEIREIKLKFNELSLDDIESLKGNRGPRGYPGKDGEDFDFDEHKEKIFNQLINLIDQNIDELKVKYSDLSDEDRESLRGQRGYRGQKGKPGKDGQQGKSAYDVWLESNEGTEEDFLNSLKGEKGESGEQGNRGLRGFKGLKGESGENGLSAYEIWSQNNEGTKEDFLNSLKGEKGEKGDQGEQGYRGQKGRRGVTGEKGDQGERGVRGPLGLPGIQGRNGRDGEDGRDGQDGQDAPVIDEIKLKKKTNNKFAIEFSFSDGSIIETNSIAMASVTTIYNSFAATGGGGGGLSSIPILLDGTLIGNAESINFLDSTVEVDGTDPNQINVTPLTKVTLFEEGVEVGDCFNKIDFCGDNVTVASSTVIADWPDLSSVTTMAGFGDETRAKVLFSNDAQRLSKTFTAGEDITAFQYVRLGVSQEVFVATNNATFEDAKVRGLALNAGLTGENISVLLFGLDDANSFNFTINNPFFLGVNGAAIQNPPVTVGEFVVELGESLGNGVVFNDIQTPQEIV